MSPEVKQGAIYQRQDQPVTKMENHKNVINVCLEGSQLPLCCSSFLSIGLKFSFSALHPLTSP